MEKKVAEARKESADKAEADAKEKRRERIETRRFWITVIIAAVAALASVGNALLLLLRG